MGGCFQSEFWGRRRHRPLCPLRIIKRQMRGWLWLAAAAAEMKSEWKEGAARQANILACGLSQDVETGGLSFTIIAYSFNRAKAGLATNRRKRERSSPTNRNCVLNRRLPFGHYQSEASALGLQPCRGAPLLSAMDGEFCPGRTAFVITDSVSMAVTDLEEKYASTLD